MSINPSFGVEGTFSPDNLIVGGPITTGDVTIVSGQNLTRGAVLGRITASDKYNLSASAAGDGSEVPRAILLRDTDASGGDVVGAPVAWMGQFAEEEVTLGAGHTLAGVKPGLREKGIFLKPTVAA